MTEQPDDPRKWKQLKQRIIREIEEGTLKPGDAIPVKSTGVTYPTAKKAFTELVTEGWLLPAVAGYSFRVPGEDPLLWRKLKNQIITEIESGILEPGDEVTVKYEAQDFKVSPQTAAKAFKALVEEGWLLPEVRGKRPYLVPGNPGGKPYLKN